MEHTQEKLLKFWLEQEPVFKQIQTKGWSEYLSSLKLTGVFELKDKKLRCIDEGTVGGIHLAGSGILNKSAAVEIVKQAGVTGIYSHAGCGAAGLYAQSQKGLDISRADEYGIDWAKELAQASDLPYEGHIELSEMARPPEFHIARVAYYDGTGKFDPSQIEGLPPGFVISRKFLTPDYAKQEADIATKIALGDHGFGKIITPESPFYLVAIGGEQKSTSLETLKQELDEIASQQQGRVTVSGFLA